MIPTWLKLLLLTVFVQVGSTWASKLFSSRAGQCEVGQSYTSCSNCTDLLMCTGSASGDVISCKELDPSLPYCKDGACQNNSTCPAQSKSPTLQNCTHIGRYPDPASCEVFHQCSVIGKPSVKYGCLEGIRFDPVRELCYKPASNSSCYTYSPSSLCKGNLLKTVRHPQRPDVYVKCDTHMHLQVCTSPSLAYNGKTGKCEFVCKEEGFFAVPGNPAKYYSCVKDGTKWIQNEFDCANGTIFDEHIGFCAPKKSYISEHF